MVEVLEDEALQIAAAHFLQHRAHRGRPLERLLRKAAHAALELRGQMQRAAYERARVVFAAGKKLERLKRYLGEVGIAWQLPGSACRGR